MAILARPGASTHSPSIPMQLAVCCRNEARVDAFVAIWGDFLAIPEVFEDSISNIRWRVKIDRDSRCDALARFSDSWRKICRWMKTL